MSALRTWLTRHRQAFPPRYRRRPGLTTRPRPAPELDLPTVLHVRRRRRDRVRVLSASDLAGIARLRATGPAHVAPEWPS